MMINRVTINTILCFICGVVLGYAARIFYENKFKNLNSKKRKRKNSDINNENLSKDVFEYEMNKLYSLLDSIKKHLNEKEQSNNDINNKLNEDEIDQEMFYDTIEIDHEENVFKEIDEMLESSNKQNIYDYLKQKLPIYGDNPEFLWRISKAAHFLAKSPSYQDKPDLKRAFFQESFEYASKSLKMNDQNANCHKWFAISIGCLSDYVTIKEKISNGIKFKEHLEIAMKLKNDDPTLYHLSGRFCLKLLSISWAERKIANVFLGGQLPTVTYQDALQYFLKAYDLKPKWKENLLFIATTLIQINEKTKAREYLNQALSIPVSDDDNWIHEKLLKIQSQIPK